MDDQLCNGYRLAEAVGKIGLHEHLCLVYETQEEQFSAALPFIKIGLERGEKCLYIADTNASATLVNAMRTHGVDVDAAMRQGGLTITDREIYPLHDGFDPGRMIEILARAERVARSAGFSALRVAGEMTWVSRTDPRPERLIEFEAKVNNLVRDHNILGICQYDRRAFPPEVVLKILCTHPTVVYGDLICKNPYYVPPEEFLKPGQSEREVQRLLNNIKVYAAIEQALRTSEEQSRALIDAIPQQIWSGPPDGSLDFCNEQWRSYTGLTLEELRGEGWRSMLHPDDRDRVLKAWQVSVTHGIPYEQEERHRRADGEYRWFLSRGVPMRDAEGRIVRWYGTNTDIEDRKRAEEELRRLYGQLLHLQDEERRKIARDLHDSTGQDLVALQTTLAQLHTLIPASNRKLRKLASECQALADQCIREVRTLSYVLHPPLLEEAGLEDAIRHFVEGFTKRSEIQVELQVSPKFGRINREAELALFRVVQESLTNIQRHSGSSTAKIQLSREAGKVTLEIVDQGRGISGNGRVQTGAIPFGVGIPSMRERLNQINGLLEIDSGSGGTTIRATLPINA